MSMNRVALSIAISSFLVLSQIAPSALAQDNASNALAKSLSLHASFDSGPDADFARGDRSLWQSPTIEKRDAATKGLPAGDSATVEPNAGRFGGAMKFAKSKGPIVFFRAEKNFNMPSLNWSGSVLFWLKTDMANELSEGFCDPVQITSKQWDDASFFVEFEKRASGTPFRLGVYSDKSVWNPTNRKFEDIPPSERPLVAVAKPPFEPSKWTHVAFTFERFNSGKPDALAILYLNGEKKGELANRTQTFSWDPSMAAVMLGLSYVGKMDDLGLFDRALTQQEITQVLELKNGLSDLVSNKK